MQGMTIIVKTIVRLLVGLIFLYGIYIIAHGHLTPGGGFAGGCILTAAFVLLTLAYGRTEASERVSSKVTSIFESMGGLMFLVIALFGFVGGWFFLNLFIVKGEPLTLWSAGIIPLCNIAIGMKVGAGLFAIFLGLAATKYMLKE